MENNNEQEHIINVIQVKYKGREGAIYVNLPHNEEEENQVIHAMVELLSKNKHARFFFESILSTVQVMEESMNKFNEILKSSSNGKAN